MKKAVLAFFKVLSRRVTKKNKEMPVKITGNSPNIRSRYLTYESLERYCLLWHVYNAI